MECIAVVPCGRAHGETKKGRLHSTHLNNSGNGDAIAFFYKEKQLGFHTYEVRRNIRLGFYIFIFTEAVCFLSLF